MASHTGEDLDLPGPSLRPQWDKGDRDKKRPLGQACGFCSSAVWLQLSRPLAQAPGMP